MVKSRKKSLFKGNSGSRKSKRTGGGAATFSGTNYQSQVGAWISVQILADQSVSLPWEFPASTTLKSLRFETEHATDDISVVTSLGGQVFIQAKHSLTLGRSATSIFASVIDQFVRQYLSFVNQRGDTQTVGKDSISNNRLVLITSSKASAVFRNDIPNLLYAIRHLSDPEKISNTASNENQKAAFEVLVSHIISSWKRALGSSPTNRDIYQLLSLVRFFVLDVSDDDRDTLDAKKTLRTIILSDPIQVDQAWNLLVQTCASLSENRASADRINLQETFSRSEILLKNIQRYQSDIDRLRARTRNTLQLLSRLSRIPLGNTELKISRPSTLALREAAEATSIIVVGNPGTGKSGALYDLTNMLLEENRDVILLAVEQLSASNINQLHEDLGLQHEFIEVVTNWHGSKPAFIIIDALDAARSENTIQTLQDLIYLLSSTQGCDRWRIVASIRKYDLRYNSELQKLFSGDHPAGFFDPEFEHICHINIPELDPVEMEQIKIQAPQVWNEILRAKPELQKLVRNPYNLKLLAELVYLGTASGDITPIRTQLDLLSRYWYVRVIRNDKKRDAREALLREAVERMVGSRSLRVSRAAIANVSNSEVLHNLLDIHILTEWQSSLEDIPDQYTITFAHHILFDFAVAQLLFLGQSSSLINRLVKEPDLIMAIRPSLSYYFQQIWVKDKSRETFWNEVFAVINTPKIPQIGKLVGPSVAVELSASFADLLPVINNFSNEDKEQKLLIQQTLKYLISSIVTVSEVSKAQILGSKANVWCALAEHLSNALDYQNVYLEKVLVSHLSDFTEELTPTQLAQLGRAARRLLLYVWEQDPNRADSSLVRFALKAVCRTCISDINETTSILEKALDPKHLSEHGYEELPTIIGEIQNLIPALPDFVQDIYIAAFSYVELSDEKTSLGGSRILSMTSTRKQDYQMARYELIEAYPGFISLYPIQATKAMLTVVNKFGDEERAEAKVQEEEFEFLGKTARIRTGYSLTWDHPYGLYEYDPPRLLQLFSQYLSTILKDESHEGIRRDLIHLIGEQNESAAVWKKLLIAGAESPEIFGLALKPLAWALPVLMGYNTSNTAGLFISALYPLLSVAEREQIENLILSISIGKSEEEKPYFEKMQNRLIGNLPHNLIVTKRGRLLAEQLIAADDVPPNVSPTEEDGLTEFRWVESPNQERGAERGEQDNLRVISSFVSEFINSIPSKEEIEKIHPKLKQIFDQTRRTLSNSPESENQIYVWRKITEACEIIARSNDINCEIEVGLTIKEILLEGCFNNDPEHQVESGTENDENVSWIPSTRVNAASGIMLILRHQSCIRPEILKVVTDLSQDPVSYVRLQVARYLYLVYVIDPQLTWEIAEKYASEEQNLSVLGLLVRETLRRLASREPDRVLDMLKAILERVDREKVKDIRSNYVSILMGEYFWRNHVRSYEILTRMVGDPRYYGIETGRLLLNMRDWIKPDVTLTEEIQIIIADRVFPLFAYVIRSICGSIMQFNLEHSNVSVSSENGYLEIIRGLAQLADTASMEIYFASGAFDEKESNSNGNKRPLKPEEKTLFLERMSPLMEELAKIGFPNIIDHLIKTLESLIKVNPRKVFLMVGYIVNEGEKGGYQYESMAMDIILRIVERYIAEYRVLLQRDKACQKTLLDLLDVFVEAGWPNAHRLAYHLEDIFR